MRPKDKNKWNLSKEPLHNKGNNEQIEKTTYRMQKIFVGYPSDKVLIARIQKELKEFGN